MNPADLVEAICWLDETALSGSKDAVHAKNVGVYIDSLRHAITAAHDVATVTDAVLEEMRNG